MIAMRLSKFVSMYVHKPWSEDDAYFKSKVKVMEAESLRMIPVEGPEAIQTKICGFCNDMLHFVVCALIMFCCVKCCRCLHDLDAAEVQQ